MTLKLPTRNGLIASLAAGLLLSACTQSSLRLQPDFGVAVRQDLAAQIADPDAHYTGVPAPGSDGSRVSLAQTRYQTGNVIPPAAISSNSSSTSAEGPSMNNAVSAAAPVSLPTP